MQNNLFPRFLHLCRSDVGCAIMMLFDIPFQHLGYPQELFYIVQITVERPCSRCECTYREREVQREPN
jgi:hypothetical protein